jgi:hypothetical protein
VRSSCVFVWHCGQDQSLLRPRDLEKNEYESLSFYSRMAQEPSVSPESIEDLGINSVEASLASALAVISECRRTLGARTESRMGTGRGPCVNSSPAPRIPQPTKVPRQQELHPYFSQSQQSSKNRASHPFAGRVEGAKDEPYVPGTAPPPHSRASANLRYSSDVGTFFSGLIDDSSTSRSPPPSRAHPRLRGRPQRPTPDCAPPRPRGRGKE